MNLPIREGAEDRLILRPKDPNDRTDFQRILPLSIPMFVHVPAGSLGPLVRWWMSRINAERLGIWGKTCGCCGAGVDLNGNVWEYDTLLSQTEWYLRGEE